MDEAERDELNIARERLRHYEDEVTELKRQLRVEKETNHYRVVLEGIAARKHRDPLYGEDAVQMAREADEAISRQP